jgi:hypothetical protein
LRLDNACPHRHRMIDLLVTTTIRHPILPSRYKNNYLMLIGVPWRAPKKPVP